MKKTVIFAIMVAIQIVSNTPGGTWETLDYPGARMTSLSGISGDNICGWGTDNTGNNYGVYYNGTSWTRLDPPGSTQTILWGMSGNVVAGYYGIKDVGYRGCLYDGTNWTTINKPGASLAYIKGIDGSNLAGFYCDSSYPRGANFVFDGQNWTTLAGYPGCIIQGISGNNVVGYYYDGSSHTHGLIYNSGVPSTFDYPGAAQTQLYDIDGNVIVGAYSLASSSSIWHGFIYNSGTWTTLDYPGANITEIMGIDGPNLVGTYALTGSLFHGFEYTIPEPATLLFFGLGGIILKRKNYSQ
jgi:hypothetical protein